MQAKHNITKGITKFKDMTGRIGNLRNPWQYTDIATKRKIARIMCSFGIRINMIPMFFLENPNKDKNNVAEPYRKQINCSKEYCVILSGTQVIPQR
jgi:hypothetical protein